MNKSSHIRKVQRLILLFILLLQVCSLHSQTLGGRSAYNFLRLPATPLLSAAGGINTSYNTNDVGLALNNPALLNDNVHTQLGLAFNGFFAGVKSYNLAGAYHHQKLATTFGASVFFIDYGELEETDASGNNFGAFRPVDYAIQLSASRTYLERWQYGISAKFINSNYGQYRSNAIAFDVGVLYSDTTNFFTASVLVKNMGTQLQSFTQDKEELPFDLQVGITKRLAKAPIGFSLTGHHLHRFKLAYEDTVFNNENNFENKSSFFNDAFTHLVIASHIYLGRNIEATIGYNPLRRQELNLGAAGNGLNGFSMGLTAKFNKLHFQYARSYYQRNNAYNQIGINLYLNQLFGLGTL